MYSDQDAARNFQKQHPEKNVLLRSPVNTNTRSTDALVVFQSPMSPSATFPNRIRIPNPEET